MSERPDPATSGGEKVLLKASPAEGNKSLEAAHAASQRKQLKKQALKGAVWTSLQNIGGKLMGTVFFLFLGRLLTPESFGLVAAASVFLALSDLLMEQGLGQALIQRKDLRPDHCDTAFWFQVIGAGLVCLIGQLLAPWLASLYGRPELTPIIRAILLVTPLTALGAVQQAILNRELQFKKVAMRTIGANLAGGLAGVTLALLGGGAWSLVAQQLVSAGAGCALLWVAGSWRPGREVNRIALRELMGFSVHLFFQRGFNLVKNRADQFLIGYVLGPVALGFYSVAFRLVDTITNLFIAPFSQLSLPVFSRLQSSDEDMRKAYDHSIRAATLLAVPASAGLLVLAPEIVHATLGGKWQEAVPLVQALALLVGARAITTANSAVLLAKGQSWLRLQVSGGSVIITFLLYVIFVHRGIVVLGVIYTACGCLLMPINAWMVHRLIGYPARNYFRALWPPLTASLAMVAAILLLKLALPAHLPATAALAATALLGAAVYAAFIWVIAPDVRQMALEGYRWFTTKLGAKLAPAN